MTEVGYTGLRISQQQVLEESDKKWRMPERIKTVQAMKTDGAISAALSSVKSTLGQVGFTIKPPVGCSDTDKERAKFIATVFDDMETPFFTVMQNVLSIFDYGFQVSEVILKRRTKANSKYDDGLIGVKALKPRSQTTLYGWEFSEDGREVTKMLQSTANLQYGGVRYVNLNTKGTTYIEIPREKFLLFRTDAANDNPEGTPFLKAAYVPWRYKKAVQEQTQIGIGRDLGGLLSLKIPAACMGPDASPSQKAVYEEYKRAARNVSMGEQSCIITPSDKNQDTKEDLFSVELLTSSGGKAYDTVAITAQLQSEMLMALASDLLQLGNNATGSFALADGKKGLVEVAYTYRLKEIAAVFDDLIIMLYKANRWETANAPKFVFNDVSEKDLESLGKFIQRVAATGVIEVDRQVLNLVRKALGVELYPDTDEPHEEYMQESTSKSGSGMEEGMPSGTGNADGGSGNSSDTNSDNAS
jgi:hypothetical protein